MPRSWVHDQGTKAGYERWVYTDRSRPPRTPLCFSLPHRRDIFQRHPHSHTCVTCLTLVYPHRHLCERILNPKKMRTSLFGASPWNFSPSTTRIFAHPRLWQRDTISKCVENASKMRRNFQMSLSQQSFSESLPDGVAEPLTPTSSKERMFSRC